MDRRSWKGLAAWAGLEPQDQWQQPGGEGGYSDAALWPPPESVELGVCVLTRPQRTYSRKAKELGSLFVASGQTLEEPASRLHLRFLSLPPLAPSRPRAFPQSCPSGPLHHPLCACQASTRAHTARLHVVCSAVSLGAPSRPGHALPCPRRGRCMFVGWQ